MYVIVDLRNGQEYARASDMDTLINMALQLDETGDIFNYAYIGEEKNKVNQDSNFVWIFYNSWHENYIAVPERELTDEARYIIEGKGFDLYADSVPQDKVKAYMKEMLPYAKPAKYEPVPLTLKEAQSFINENHRHHKQPQGHRQSVGITVNQELIGVIVAGRPVSRHIDYQTTLEVTRCCVLEGFKNAVSKLYGQICKIAKATGYKKIITYTLINEPGTSMKAVGFQMDLISKGGSWDSLSRKRENKHPTSPKVRWSKLLN